LSIEQCSPRLFNHIDIVLSSNVSSVFNLEMYNMEQGATLMGKSEVRMEELLQARFENSACITLFNGQAKFNLEYLLYQINKKYVIP
jgi:Ras GTPase-activating-like protein IQGAP2/3